ncbi:MAG: hypothetical protein KatS3mg022_2636 [Armatimonadota bacterium]|nr:MAG: hypothetical protein KatS3mg022_2636 [Armatimonadota bacterium]
MICTKETSKATAVVDTSVWIALSFAHHVDLLPPFFAKVYLPQSVYQEILRGEQRVGSAELHQVTGSWLDLVRSGPVPADIPSALGMGEREALSIALRASRSRERVVVLLDDLLARRWAQQHNIPVLGTLGILKLARETGVVPSLRPLLEKLSEAGFHMKHDLYIRIMRQVGEIDTE